MISAKQLIDRLRLEPLAMEGGYFAETYRSAETIPKEVLPGRYEGSRPFCTAIYYLLTPDTFSCIHRLRSDEIYHFYLGGPVEMLQIKPDGSATVLTLGPDLLSGMVPQAVVPKDVWQGSRLLPGCDFALLGTTLAPGFDPTDREYGRRDHLLRLCPEARDLIIALTRE